MAVTGRRRVPRVAAPLLRAHTYVRAVHLLLGAVLLVPYVAVSVMFSLTISRSEGQVAALAVLVVFAAAVAVGVAFLATVRPLEIVTARTLLGLDLPDPQPETVRRWGSRWRGALWYLVTMFVGGATVSALLYGVPIGVGFVAAPVGGVDDFTVWLLGDRHVVLDSGGIKTAVVVCGLLILVACLYLVAAAGWLLTWIAPALLGPTPDDELLALHERERRLAARNDLARELHDSVGHALTAITMQATAAARVLDTDRDFARAALERISETGGSALAELDEMLGVLRRGDGGDGSDGGDPERRASATLGSLERLVRSSGARVEQTVHGDLAALPANVSREGYRIVQESLTNALRHGDGGAVRLRIDAGGESLEVAVMNRVAQQAGPASGDSNQEGERVPGRGGPVGMRDKRRDGRMGRRVGQGLNGLRERVLLLGGDFHAGMSEDGEWRLRATLPHHVPEWGSQREASEI